MIDWCAPATVLTTCVAWKLSMAPPAIRTTAPTSRQRQQNAHDGAHEVDPEVAELFGARAGEPANERDSDDDADGCRREVLDGEAGHLRDVAESRFAGVRLPVGVGHEARRRVERLGLLHALESLAERQMVLRAKQQIQAQHRDGREGQHAAQVRRPLLVGIRIDTDRPVDGALRPQMLLRRVHPRHVVAERPVREHEGDYQGAR